MDHFDCSPWTLESFFGCGIEKQSQRNVFSLFKFSPHVVSSQGLWILSLNYVWNWSTFSFSGSLLVQPRPTICPTLMHFSFCIPNNLLKMQSNLFILLLLKHSVGWPQNRVLICSTWFTEPSKSWPQPVTSLTTTTTFLSLSPCSAQAGITSVPRTWPGLSSPPSMLFSLQLSLPGSGPQFSSDISSSWDWEWMLDLHC